MRNLLLATRNPHKTEEFLSMLGDTFEIADLNGVGVPAVEETGQTLEENATLKALHISKMYDGVVLADDSGLEVDALKGAPGVLSARYAGPGANDARNRAHLLRELWKARVPEGKSKARFRCVLVLAGMGDVLRVAHGTVEGTIIGEERGEGGFGYDSLFIPEGHTQTFAELTAEVKNTLSHRARAVEALMPTLHNL